MQSILHEFNNFSIVEIISDYMVINKLQDALDIMADNFFQGINKIVLYEKNINPDFFDLKTGLAGDILQKFSTYNVQLAIIGDFTKYNSKSLKDFILSIFIV